MQFSWEPLEDRYATTPTQHPPWNESKGRKEGSKLTEENRNGELAQYARNKDSSNCAKR